MFNQGTDNILKLLNRYGSLNICCALYFGLTTLIKITFVSFSWLGHLARCLSTIQMAITFVKTGLKLCQDLSTAEIFYNPNV